MWMSERALFVVSVQTIDEREREHEMDHRQRVSEYQRDDHRTSESIRVESVEERERFQTLRWSEDRSQMETSFDAMGVVEGEMSRTRKTWSERWTIQGERTGCDEPRERLGTR